MDTGISAFSSYWVNLFLLFVGSMYDDICLHVAQSNTSSLLFDITPAGLHNKLLKPLAQGASRFEKLLA